MRILWKSLSLISRVVIAIWAIAIIAFVIFLIVRHNKNKDDANKNSNTPEVAQTYEPSIGTPLPPDVQPEGGSTKATATVENSGEIAGATTDEPSNASSPEEAQEMMVAPKTGIDPNEPVIYENQNFKAVLPAGTQVSEKSTEIVFTSKSGILLFQVSVNNADGETLQSIEAQLKNSPSVSNISQTNFNGSVIKSLSFTVKGFGQGTAIIANGKIYYLLGNSKYFSTFKF